MHKNREHKFGVIRDTNPNNFKQHLAGATPTTPVFMPDIFFSLPALMQGESPECGGFSLAQMINYFQVIAGKPSNTLSGSYDYAYEKTVDGVPNEEGTFISALGITGGSGGSCLNTLFPDDGDTTTNPRGTSTLFTAATVQSMSDAETRETGEPIMLTDLSMSGLQQAIEQYGAIILEVKVGDEWYTAANGQESWYAKDILPIRPPVSVIDGHFVLAGAYDATQDQLWFINSWSNQWGKNGFGYFQSNYIPYIVAAMTFSPQIKGTPTPTNPTRTVVEVNQLQLILAWLKSLFIKS